jgi:hypothetical protein
VNAGAGTIDFGYRLLNGPQYNGRLLAWICVMGDLDANR